MANNQNEKEFFALVTTGRKGVEEAMTQYGGEIMKVAAPNVNGQFDTWRTRAIVEVSSRDELKDVINTKSGVLSVFRGLTKAATMGLQIGGQFPHCYLVPKEGKAMLVTTADGYAFASVHGPGAVLENVPQLMKVFEKDTFSVDAAAGTYTHNFSPFGDRGKLIGYFMKLDYRNGHSEIPFISRKEVEDISNHYSTKEYANGKKAPAWMKSPEAMLDKIAVKQLLKKPVKESEGLAMMLSAEDDAEAMPSDSSAPDLRDVTERMADRLDGAAETYTEASEPESEPLPKKPVDKAEKPLSQGDIF